MRVSEIRVNQIRVNQGLGVCIISISLIRKVNPSRIGVHEADKLVLYFTFPF